MSVVLKSTISCADRKEQVAQLSQRDRIAEWVSFGQDDILQTYYRCIFNHCDSKAIEFGKITQNKGYYAVQGHLRSSMSVPIESAYTAAYN